MIHNRQLVELFDAQLYMEVDKCKITILLSMIHNKQLVELLKCTVNLVLPRVHQTLAVLVGVWVC